MFMGSAIRCWFLIFHYSVLLMYWYLFCLNYWIFNHYRVWGEDWGDVVGGVYTSIYVAALKSSIEFPLHALILWLIIYDFFFFKFVVVFSSSNRIFRVGELDWVGFCWKKKIVSGMRDFILDFGNLAGGLCWYFFQAMEIVAEGLITFFSMVMSFFEEFAHITFCLILIA